MTPAERLRASDVTECLAAMAQLSERCRAEDDELSALADSLGDQRKVVQRRAAETFAVLAACGVAVQPVLLAALDSGAPRQRWGAAFALSLLDAPPARALPVLLECLGYDDGDIRWAAASILVRMTNRLELIDALRTLLLDGNPLQRKMAAYCLRDAAARLPVVEDALCAALNDSDAGVRLAAMASLTRLSTNPAVAQRLIALLSDGDQGVRRAAAAALGAFGERSETVLGALRSAAADPDKSLQRAAARSLRLLVNGSAPGST